MYGQKSSRNGHTIWMGEKDMRRSLCLLAMLLLLLPTVVSAHIVNEQNLYDDLQYSKATPQIVQLSGLGVIAYDHGSTLFSPQEKLTREELAHWAGAFWKLKESGAAREQVTAAALEKGLVPSLDGNATYADVNQAYFAGKLAVPEQDAARELTKEEFAVFVFEHRNDAVEGKSLYDRGGFVAGPTGKVEKVAVREEKDAAGKTSKVYSLTISGTVHDLSAHPRVLQAAVDPAQWEGKTVEEAWLMNVAGKPQLQLILFAKSADASGQSAQPEKAPTADHAHAGHTDHAAAASGDETGASMVPLVVAVVLLALVGGWLFARRRK